MKKIGYGIVALIGFVILLSMCNGCSHTNSLKIEDLLKIESEYYDSYGVTKMAKVRNVSDKTLNGSIQIKVHLKNGVSSTQTCYITNMEPNEVQEIDIYVGGVGDLYSVESWSFLD